MRAMQLTGMIRTMADVALAVHDYIDEILVVGSAVNYATNKGKYRITGIIRKRKCSRIGNFF